MVFFRRRGQPQGLITYVEYIESSGMQYIDTGFNPNNNSRVVIKFQGGTSSEILWLFGGRNSNSNGTVGLLWYGARWNADYAGNQQRYAFSGSIKLNTLVTADYNKNVVTLNEYQHTFSQKSFQSNYPLALLAVNTGGVISGEMSGKLYYAQIYDNGVLIRDYLPCKDKSGVACLYDKVSGEYVYNSGSGAFTAGPEL